MKKTFLPHYSLRRWKKSIDLSVETVYGNTVPPSSLKAVPSCIFPVLQSLHVTTQSQRRLATLTLLAHRLRALSSVAGPGREASKLTIDSYITKWRVHTGKQLCLLPLKPQAPKTSGAIPALLYKTILIWQHRLRFVFTDVSGELVKTQDTVESDPGNRETCGRKRIIPAQLTILLLRAYSEPHVRK